MPLEVVEIDFPLNGLDENTAYREQPPLTTPDALNVRPYDTIRERARGGSRPGTKKFWAAQINAANQVQALHQLTVAFNPDLLVADVSLVNETFPYSDGELETVSSGTWTTFKSNAGSGNVDAFTNADATTMDVSSNVVVRDAAPLNGVKVGALRSAISGLTSAYVIQLTTTVDNRPGGASVNDTTGKSGIVFRHSGTANTDYFALCIERTANDAFRLKIVKIIDVGSHSSIITGTPTFSLNTVATPGMPDEATITMELSVNGNRVAGKVSGVPGATITGNIGSDFDSNTRVGFYFNADNTAPEANADDFKVFTGSTPALQRTVRSVAVAGGTIKAGTGADQPLSVTNGASAMSALETRTGVQGAFNRAYFCDGKPENYKVLDFATETVTHWQLSVTEGTLPVSADGGVAYSVEDADAVADTFDITEDLTGVVTENESYIVISGTNISGQNDGTYFVTGTSFGTPTTLTVQQLPGQPSIVTDNMEAGTMRVANRACREVKLYRGRVALTQMASDPQNWFLPKSGNPNDWNYSPATTNATQAVAGNNSDAGKIGDVITALAPYSDDLMVMGGDHTLWVMRGDPADGGSIDLISNNIGIMGPDAFAWAPNGDLYFVGNIGLFRLPAGGSQYPVQVSERRLDKFFTDIDFGSTRVLLEWDRDRQGLHIFLTPQTGVAHTHVWWDETTDSFWKEQYASEFGPTAVLNFDADDPNDRRVLMGGFDGYVRVLDEATKNDDTTSSTQAISSHVLFPTISVTSLARIKLQQAIWALDEASDDAVIEVYSGETSQATVNLAIAGTEWKYRRTVGSGRNSRFSERVADNALVFRLENTAASKRWAFEDATAVLVLPAGTQRVTDRTEGS